MINIILNCFLSISLFISGGHILSSNFKSHHYSGEDYKEISYLKNHDTISKYCTKHSELENIKKIRSNHDGVDRTIYKVVKDVENISSTED
mgnify:FL=1